MIQNAYGASVGLAVFDCIKNSPDRIIRKKYKDLEYYHFGRPKKDYWTKHSNFKSKIGLKAVTELIDKLKDDKGWSYQDIVTKFKIQHIHFETLKYGHSICGFSKKTEMNIYEIVSGYFKNHRLKRVREKFKDLKEYHFHKRLNVWCDSHKRTRKKVVLDALSDWIKSLQTSFGWSYDEIIENAKNFHLKHKMKYGVDIENMFFVVYKKSLAHALLDYFRNHSNKNIRAKYSYLELYHFGVNTHYLWNLPDGRKNLPLARKATRELVETLADQNQISFKDMLDEVRVDDFYQANIRHGKNLTSMIQSVYGNNVTKALEHLRKS